jgi:hypothetical protein
MDQHLHVTASEAEPAERQRLWQKLITISPQFKSYETRTTRTIPMLLLKPQ